MKSHIRVKDMIFFISLRVFYKKIALILFPARDKFLFNTNTTATLKRPSL